MKPSSFHAFTSDNGLEPLFKPSVRSQWDKLPRKHMGITSYHRERVYMLAVFLIIASIATYLVLSMHSGGAK